MDYGVVQGDEGSRVGVLVDLGQSTREAFRGPGVEDRAVRCELKSELHASGWLINCRLPDLRYLAAAHHGRRREMLQDALEELHRVEGLADRRHGYC